MLSEWEIGEPSFNTVFGMTTPEGCRNWAPYARWMEIAQNRTLWRMFTWNTLLNEEYWNQIKGRLPAK